MANTVSLDVARRLKAAGCIWKPRPYDRFIYQCGSVGRITDKEYMFVVDYPERFTWLPGLSDILSRLEELGYKPLMQKVGDNYYCEPNREYAIGGITWEDAAGEVLIWALGQEGGRA